jgi:hypothetical protein
MKPVNRLFISFSGGETSAFMAQWLIENRADQYDEVLCLFANTGQENEETLYFVERCDQQFGLNVVWVEADVQHGSRESTKHRVVDFVTASRQGEPFESVIEKYGIPNQAYPHCTRELKLNPMRSYLDSIGWEKGTYDTAIGIRSDEIDRISPERERLRLIYPLVTDKPMTKPRINQWWSGQPFRLNLKGYEGNCKWCWKKSLRKHLTLITEHPEWYKFPERMEREHGLSGHNIDGTPRVFFRGGRCVDDIRQIAAQGGWQPAADDARDYTDQLELDLDVGGGCTESCEVNWEDAA